MQPPIDLTNCDREPIQWPGFIQPHGYLLALDPNTLTIWQASENVTPLTGQPVEDIIGKTIDQIQLDDRSGPWLKDLLTLAVRSGNPEAISPYPVQLGGQPWLILLHQHDGALILELEPAQQAHDSVSLPLPMLLNQAMSDIQRSKTLAELLHKTAQQVKQITGFDRVMIYRFSEDWHGEVIAEARQDQLEPFLGLHYPPSDIPRQARELYKINLVRGIGDVNQPRVAILPIPYAHYNRPLDLTHANLRAVSPIHVEYLRNMGVRASMSISLLYRGELWGLIACHHYSAARYIDYQTRQSLKLISQLLSTVLQIRKEDEEEVFSAQLNAVELALHRQMQTDWDVVQGLTRHPVTLLNLNSATGAAVLFDGKLHLLGETPSSQEVMEIIEWVQNITTESVFQTDQLPNLYPPAEEFRHKASGLLLLVLSRQMNEYLLWFKPEQLHEVAWGGNPEKPVVANQQGELRLSPRQSFDKWTQLVRNKAQPWQPMEVTMALKLREDLLQLVAQKANQIRTLNEQLRFSNEELEAFSYTISHELRSPLTSIKRYTEIYRGDYGAQMDEQAQAIFDKIVKASDRMSMLIRTIMQYSKVGSGGLARKVLPMRELLNQLREELLTGETDRDLSFDMGETPDLVGDQTMVTQVFSNLLSNAFKYSRSVPHARVSVQGSQTGQEVIYAVSDNGIGIDMKQVGKVFELFQRLDSASGYEGYGVGLAIVKRIMNRHQGKVWFETIPNQLTTFYVSFPTPTA
jgi:chemotaxis family two-component system sensor kinase Cph1